MRHLSITFIVAVLAMALASTAIACKRRAETPRYPLANLNTYSEVVVIKVLSSEQDKSGWYDITRSIKAEVIYALKGNLEPGDTILAKHKQEDAHAVCPVYLELGQSYLLPLHKKEDGYSYSRFSLIVSEENEKFDDYVSEIRDGI